MSIATATNRPARARAASLLADLAQRREYGVAAMLMIMLVGISIANPDFRSHANLRNILVNSAPVAIIACGMTLVIAMGEIDISVGSMMGFLAAVMGVLASPSREAWPVWLVIIATLGCGALLGLINGLLVTLGRVPSIIATLGMLTILHGATQVVMAEHWIELPAGLDFLGKGTILHVLPVSVLAAVLVAILCAVLARRMPWGLRMYAIGSNPSAARLLGLPIDRLKVLAFVITGIFTAVATLVSVTQLSTVDARIGEGYELLVVTCVVVGGASVSGGQGTIFGTLLAVLLLTTVRTVLIFSRIEGAAYWEKSIQGAFILAAVLVDHVARRARHAEEL